VCSSCKIDLNVIYQMKISISNVFPIKNIEFVEDTKFDITKLLNMNVEARDRKNPSICAPATISNNSNITEKLIHKIFYLYKILVDTNRQTGQILLNFDGWSAKFNYWANITDEDILPCGFWAYWKSLGNLTYLTMSRFDMPQHYPKEFDWGIYLQETNKQAVPFNIFSKV
jgi:hypothetical protein